MSWSGDLNLETDPSSSAVPGGLAMDDAEQCGFMVTPQTRPGAVSGGSVCG